MRKQCPKCKGFNTYIDGIENACLMCGKRWPINGQQPVVFKQIIGGKRIMEKTSSGKVGKCLNCEREKFIAGADGLCGTCHVAVKGLTPGNQAYQDILANVKQRLTDPSKSDGRIGKKPEKKKPKTRTLSPSPIETPRERADVILKKAIEILIPERDFHLSFAEKLNKAIEALRS